MSSSVEVPSSAAAPTGAENNEPSDQAQIHDPIEIDETPSIENDSAFGDEATSYTTSVTSSIMDYKYENGRRYHAFRAGQYIMPNDETEQDRMDLLHHIFSMIFNGALNLAPISENPQRVLDVGTGTGIWAITFADQYPSAEVIGMDLSPIQPGWVPPNLSFQIDDAESEWTFPLNAPFDFIYLRSMGGSIADWGKLFKQAYDHLTPGGWLELSEFEAWASTDDDSLPETSSYHTFQVALHEASAKFGRIMNIAPHHKQAVIDAGFANVTEEIIKVPLSPWPRDPKLKELGRYMQVQMIDALESYGMALLTRVLGWDATRTTVLIAGARNDLRNRDYHLYSKCHCVYGQKPLES